MIRPLSEIGFDWDRIGSSWQVNFLRLVEYKAKFGNCLVPQKDHIYRQLGIWVGEQRRAKQNGKLAPEYTKQLEDIGFEWNPGSAAWDANFDELRRYRDEYGDCTVPQRHAKYSTLGRWVRNQRIDYIEGVLNQAP